MINIVYKIKGKIQTFTGKLYLFKKKNQTELTDITSEIKNTIDGYKSRLNTGKGKAVIW